MEFLKEDTELIIPKISSKLYTKSINDTLNKILNQENNKNINNINIKDNLRYLKEKKEKI